MADADVPCNGCTACCRSAAVGLRPELGDKPSDYETEPGTDPRTGAPMLMLKRSADGACIYLRDGGCAIYDKRPVICRSFDCRTFYRATLTMMTHLVVNPKEVRFLPSIQPVLDAGEERSRGAAWMIEADKAT